MTANGSECKPCDGLAHLSKGFSFPSHSASCHRLQDDSKTAVRQNDEKKLWVSGDYSSLPHMAGFSTSHESSVDTQIHRNKTTRAKVVPSNKRRYPRPSSSLALAYASATCQKALHYFNLIIARHPLTHSYTRTHKSF